MKMKRVGSAVMALVLVLVLGLALAPAFGEEAFAATGGSMKSLKVKWDLKKGKKVTVSAAWAGAGRQKVSARVVGLKVGASPKRNVTIKASNWKCSKVKKYKDDHGCWVQYPTKYAMKVTVTVPQKYRGLCLGIIANNKRSETKADSAFWEGRGSFAKTTYYKSGKGNSHWMRIR